MKIFQYISFGLEIVATIEQILILAQSGPLSGPTLYLAVQPALSGLHALIPKITIPADLAQSICQAVADTVNNYHHPKPAPPVA